MPSILITRISRLSTAWYLHLDRLRRLVGCHRKGIEHSWHAHCDPAQFWARPENKHTNQILNVVSRVVGHGGFIKIGSVARSSKSFGYLLDFKCWWQSFSHVEKVTLGFEHKRRFNLVPSVFSHLPKDDRPWERGWGRRVLLQPAILRPWMFPEHRLKLNGKTSRSE